MRRLIPALGCLSQLMLHCTMNHLGSAARTFKSIFCAVQHFFGMLPAPRILPREDDVMIGLSLVPLPIAAVSLRLVGPDRGFARSHETPEDLSAPEISGWLAATQFSICAEAVNPASTLSCSAIPSAAISVASRPRSRGTGCQSGFQSPSSGHDATCCRATAPAMHRSPVNGSAPGRSPRSSSSHRRTASSCSAGRTARCPRRRSRTPSSV